MNGWKSADSFLNGDLPDYSTYSPIDSAKYDHREKSKGKSPLGIITLVCLAGKDIYKCV
jgi:hypothetical protein